MIRRLHFQGTAVGAAAAQACPKISENGVPAGEATFTVPVAGCIAKVGMYCDTAAQLNSITITRSGHGGRDVIIAAPGDLAAEMELELDFMDKFGAGIVVNPNEIITITGNFVGAAVGDIFLEIIDGGRSADYHGIRIAGSAAAVADTDVETGANMRAGILTGLTYRPVAIYAYGAATTKSWGLGLADRGISIHKPKSVVVNAGQPHDILRPDLQEALTAPGETWRAQGRLFVNDSAATAAAAQLVNIIFQVG